MEFVYVLRTCNADMSSAHDPTFIWPKSGPVHVRNWDPTPKCGGGLHGFLNGDGDVTLIGSDPNQPGLIVRVAKADIVQLDGKVKFQRGEVVFCGTRQEACDRLATMCPGPVMFAKLTGGNYATLTGGHHATLTGGYGATLTGGNYATLTGGNYATLTGGYGATLTGGYGAKLTGGHHAKLTGGYGAKLVFTWCNGRSRTTVAYVGEDDIKANVAYRCVDGKVVRV
jgi:hypothetical protein